MYAQSDKLVFFKQRIRKYKEQWNRIEGYNNWMKSTLEGINSRLNEEEWITELEDRVVEITMAEQKKKKKWKEMKTA